MMENEALTFYFCWLVCPTELACHRTLLLNFRDTPVTRQWRCISLKISLHRRKLGMWVYSFSRRQERLHRDTKTHRNNESIKIMSIEIRKEIPELQLHIYSPIWQWVLKKFLQMKKTLNIKRCVSRDRC